MPNQIQLLPETEQPRERLVQVGEQALSEIELLACLLGKGSRQMPVLVLAQRLLQHMGSLAELHNQSIEQLEQLVGVGRAKAVMLKAAAEVGRRSLLPQASKAQSIVSDREAMDWFKPRLLGKSREQCMVLFLNARSEVIRGELIAQGTLSRTVVHPRDVFQQALKADAASVILAHNHPSGNPEPSQQDIEMTRRFVKAGRVLGIPVIDHIIVAAGGSVSLRAENYVQCG